MVPPPRQTATATATIHDFAELTHTVSGVRRERQRRLREGKSADRTASESALLKVECSVLLMMLRVLCPVCCVIWREWEGLLCCDGVCEARVPVCAH